ncbi:GHKL domain-containing protein [Thiomicrospira microaerophila]|uniref:PAS domain-containing sensor histidine kinase n=1 Tax=Thiomicrospira microaerophila TaxID=406020 RepID=UPI00200DE81C|nr:ATP-binding protein [Thiomicrospira microaerophila]UQB42294.1 GHKL domain-containing protein [Thiomicrospira microaerophila]
MISENHQNKNGQLSFILLAMMLSLILIALTYFYSVLQPKLQSQTENQASLIINMMVQNLLRQEVLENADLLSGEIQKLLSYSAEVEQPPFVKGLKIRFNSQVFPDHSGSLIRGNIECHDCFEIEKKLYSNQNNTVIAQVNFWIEPEYLDDLTPEFTFQFIAFLLGLVVMIGFVWKSIHKLNAYQTSTNHALRQTKEFNNKIINTIQDWLLVIDQDGRILNANQSALSQLNKDLSQINKKLIQQFVKPLDTHSSLIEQIQNKAENNKDEPQIEVKFKLKNQIEHYGVLTSTGFKDFKTTQPVQYLVIIKDIQSIKLAEAKLAYQAQMAHAGRLKSLGEMATGIAHEINQPLAVIRLAAEGIKESLSMQNPDAFEIEITQDIVNQVDRISVIINNMRSYARLNPSPRQWIAPHKPINNALTFFREQLRVNAIDLIEEIREDCPNIQVEQQKLEQVIVNIITNASQALEKIAHQHRKIRVHLECDLKHVILTIEDNGCGMDEMTRQHCLDPFYTTKETGEGTGLGLSIVNNILHEFNIELKIESKLGKGTRFILYIPHQNAEATDD